MVVTMASSDSDGPTMLVPPETRSTTERGRAGSTLDRSSPRVAMRASAWGSSGATADRGDRIPLIGPRK